MREILSVVYRYLTHADFFNMYKPAGTEAGGGGQTYIDFGTGSIEKGEWKEFLRGVRGLAVTRGAVGPRWQVPVRSIGVGRRQVITIYQRRKQSFSIAVQHIGTAESNRVLAWHPDFGFPQPNDPEDRRSRPDGLAVYLVRCADGTVWAGWFQGMSPCRDAAAGEALTGMTARGGGDGQAGMIRLGGQGVLLDVNDSRTPIMSRPMGGARRQAGRRRATVREAERLETERLLKEDAIELPAGDRAAKRKVREVLERNRRAVRALKRLYRGECQLTGSRLTFAKVDGALYSEAHHLVALGDEGADSPYNIIVVSPLIHRMLHYGEVRGLDLARISEDNTLTITINGEPFTIRWHPSHARLVRGRRA